MITCNSALAAIAVGVALFALGVYGVIGPEFSMLLAALGILVLLFGIAFLLSTLRPFRLSAPHSYVVGIAVAAAALHAYARIYNSSGDPSLDFLVWPMVPYALCITLSAFAGIRVSVIAGAAIALVFDLWGHYSVFVNPDKGSTAALALLFIPLWSTIIVVPVATFIAWSITQRRRCSQDNTP